MRPEELKIETKAEIGDGVLGEGQQAPSLPATGLCCELRGWGSG